MNSLIPINTGKLSAREVESTYSRLDADPASPEVVAILISLIILYHIWLMTESQIDSIPMSISISISIDPGRWFLFLPSTIDHRPPTCESYYFADLISGVRASGGSGSSSYSIPYLQAFNQAQTRATSSRNMFESVIKSPLYYFVTNPCVYQQIASGTRPDRNLSEHLEFGLTP